ncbi:tripartite tricarboxylate transporter TctB family protein [Modicisalibacter xianhensis]|uniref:Tripartite tricarboxylate transporter TctB family protein n=1 Tax=Modicisalibacter xianhensis TaxID=442341 RepID=A0A4R8FUG2_9GAMM|nr:tripartite tricarboxylate transporter TctB family protein [Halomonas xianhensis]TDX27615.1 tripartite tricarboxylate transporter TctB family protein [Halomonas xianhensis]
MSKYTKLQPGERVFNILLLLFSLGVLYEAYRISGPGFESINSPGAFPVGLGVILIASMIVIIAGQFRKPKPDTKGALDEARQFLQLHFPLPIVVFSAMAIGYLLLLEPLGFVIATLLFLFVSMVYLRHGRFVSSAIIAAVAITVIYALFKLLFQVYLP